MKKTTADLPELAQKAASDKNFRDHLFWSMVTLYPDAFLRLVNGDSMESTNEQPVCIMTDYQNETITVTPTLYRKVRDYAIAGKKVDAIKELCAGAGLGLKEAKDFVDGTFPTNRNHY